MGAVVSGNPVMWLLVAAIIGAVIGVTVCAVAYYYHRRYVWPGQRLVAEAIRLTLNAAPRKKE